MALSSLIANPNSSSQVVAPAIHRCFQILFVIEVTLRSQDQGVAAYYASNPNSAFRT